MGFRRARSGTWLTRIGVLAAGLTLAASSAVAASPAAADESPLTLPGPPKNVSAIGYARSIEMAWDDGYFGGYESVDYRVRDTVSGKVWTAGAAGRLTITGVRRGQVLKLRVAAVNPVGVSAETPAVTVTPHPLAAGPRWRVGSPMRNARQGAASVTLADGRVLVAGGVVFRSNGTPVPVRTAELYDPRTKRWSAAASLPAPLAAFSLTRLRDGRVLLAGGIDDRTHAPSARAYVFSPATKRWTSTASLRQARARQQAVLLRDGTVLVSGGYVGGFVDDITTAAETYDPRKGRWVPAGRMRQARAGAFSVALADGRVLVAGGWSPGDDQQRSAEIYRPASRSWVATRSMTYGRYGDHGTATRLKDGRVLVVGGYFENDYYSPWPNPFDRRREAFAEVFLPARNAWRVTGRLAVPVQDAFTTTLLPSGRVLLAGGLARNDPLAVTQEFDPATGRWHRRNDLTAPLYGHVAALVAGGRVLVAGGALNTLGSATPGAPAMNRRTLLYGP